jgi:hypothetical protein
MNLLNGGDSTVIADGNLAEYGNYPATGLNMYDIPKSANINESLSLNRFGTLLSIERKPMIVSTDTLFYNLKNSTQRNYQFRFIPNGMQQTPGLQAFLKDSYLNDSTSVSLVDNDTTTVNFTINSVAASQAANRFMVVFEQDIAPLPVTFTDVKATQQGTGVNVQWSVKNELNSVKSYEVEKSTDGVNFTQASIVKATDAGTYNWLDANPVNGSNYYRIISVGTNGQLQYSSIVEVTIGEAPIATIGVYPNPIVGNNIGLQLTNMPAGQYRVRLLDDIGQTIETTEFMYNGGSAVQDIQVISLAQGTYLLEVTGPGGAVNTLKVVK